MTLQSCSSATRRPVLCQPVSLGGVPEQVDHCRGQCPAVPDREESGGLPGQLAKGLEIRGDDGGAGRHCLQQDDPE